MDGSIGIVADFNDSFQDCFKFMYVNEDNILQRRF